VWRQADDAFRWLRQAHRASTVVDDADCGLNEWAERQQPDSK